MFFVGFFTYSTIRDIEIDRVEDKLKSIILVSALQLNEQSDLEEFAKILKSTTHLRVTIINHEGNVVAETDKNKTLLDNHSSREEILGAKGGDFGLSLRKSDTVDKDMMYVAKKIKIGDKHYYLRVSRYIEDFNQEFMNLSFQILFLIAVFFILAFAIAYNLNNQIKHEIDKIAEFLNDLTAKNFNIELKSSFSEEFFKISQALTKVTEKLKKREEKKAKYTQKLLKSNQQKDEIISAISHEFKNPIAVIKGYCETLISDKNINAVIRDKFLDKISNSAARLSSMIDRLRFATKLEDKKFEATFKDCNISKICERIIANIKVEYPTRVVVFEKLSEDLVYADEVLLEMAILNLVENGLKYSEGKVTIKYDGNNISVIDKGIGIAQNEIDKITGKFYRVNSNVWNNSLGLGLSIVQNILNLQNFKLSISSEIGVGSSFTICLTHSHIE